VARNVFLKRIGRLLPKFSATCIFLLLADPPPFSPPFGLKHGGAFPRPSSKSIPNPSSPPQLHRSCDGDPLIDRPPIVSSLFPMAVWQRASSRWQKSFPLFPFFLPPSFSSALHAAIGCALPPFLSFDRHILFLLVVGVSLDVPFFSLGPLDLGPEVIIHIAQYKGSFYLSLSLPSALFFASDPLFSHKPPHVRFGAVSSSPLR